MLDLETGVDNAVNSEWQHMELVQQIRTLSFHYCQLFWLGIMSEYV